MISSTITKIKHHLFHLVTLHLFMTAVSLPILIAWGLPISLLSILGNVIFSPFITLFLASASGLFFCLLLGLPPTFFVMSLEWITSCWLWLLKRADNSALLAVAQPPFFLICLIGFSFFVFAVIAQSRKKLVIVSLVAMVLLALMSTFFRSASILHEIPCNKGAVVFMKKQGKSYVIDEGQIGRHACASSWVIYTLVPALIQKNGSLMLDYFVATKPTIYLLQALRELLVRVKIKALYLPENQFDPQSTSAQEYQLLCQQAEKEGTKIILVTDTISLPKNEKLVTLTPCKKQAKLPSYFTISFG